MMYFSLDVQPEIQILKVNYDRWLYWCNRAVGRSENPGVPRGMLGIIGPPDWNRANWSAKIWGCHGTPGTPRDDTPEVYIVCTQTHPHKKTYLRCKRNFPKMHSKDDVLQPLSLCALIVIYGFRLANSKKVFCIKNETLIEINILDPQIQVLSWMRCCLRFIYWGIHHLEKHFDLIFLLKK